MKVVLRTDDDKAMGDWTIREPLTRDEFDKVLADGLAVTRGIEQCDDCGAFVAKDQLRERGEKFLCDECDHE